MYLSPFLWKNLTPPTILCKSVCSCHAGFEPFNLCYHHLSDMKCTQVM